MKDKIVALLEGDLQAKEFFLREIKKVAGEMEPLLKARLEDDYGEEILSDLLLKLLIMKDALLQKEKINRSYLHKVIRSCIIDRLSREGKLQTLSMDRPLWEDDEGEIRSFEEVFGVEENRDLKIEAGTLFDEIMSFLSEKDRDVLCYYLYKELYNKEVKVEGISKGALYKRWERLKAKINRKLSFVPTQEEFRLFAERFLSEVCTKRGFK